MSKVNKKQPIEKCIGCEWSRLDDRNQCLRKECLYNKILYNGQPKESEVK